MTGKVSWKGFVGRLLPVGQFWMQLLLGSSHVPRGKAAAGWHGAPRVGSVQIARWSASEGLLACAELKTFLSLLEGCQRTQFWGQGFWAGGPGQRLRALLAKSKTEVKVKVNLPRWHSDKESACQCRRCRRSGFGPWVRKTLNRKWQPIMVFLPGKSCGQRSSVGYSPWGHRELDTTEHMHIRQRWSFQNGVQLWAGLGPRSEPGCWIVSPGRVEPQNSSSIHTGLLKGGSVWWLESRCWGQTVWIWILLLPSANCVILITSLCFTFFMKWEW